MFHTGHEFKRIVQTRLPSNLKPTTRKCVHLVTRGHFPSGEEDAWRHTVQSDVSENPLLPGNFTALCAIEAELSLIEVLRCGNRDFRRTFACVTLILTDNFRVRT